MSVDRLESACSPGLSLMDADELGPLVLTAEEEAEQDQIVAALVAFGAGDEPPDVNAGMWVDPESGPPMGKDFWLGQLPHELLEDVLAERDVTADPPVKVPFLDDVTDRSAAGAGGSGSGFGFGFGAILDQLEPGPVLVQALEDVRDQGLENLPDDELAGVMLAGQRLESRGAATLVTATAELDRRRRASGDERVYEHTDNEVAILMALTRTSAQRLLDFADGLTRLPATAAALWDGRIDRAKAELIAYEASGLDPELAAAVEMLVIEDAPRLTTTMLRRRLRRAVIAADPAAAQRRKAKAARQARVELFDERSGGTAGLGGRDLPVAGALAADRRIDTAARALKSAGVAGTLPQLRAAVFLGLLTGTDPRGFLPPPDSGEATSGPVRPASAGGQNSGPASTRDRNSRPASTQDQDTDPARSKGQDASPAAAEGRGADSVPDRPDAPWPGPEALPLRGSVNLTMPLASWLGTSRSPGDVEGFGPATAETCQDLADWIARSPGTRWCVTVTDKAGRAVGHGCARKPPPPRDDPAGLAAWLARLKVEPIEAGTCTHAREVSGYRIPARLHHFVKIRQRTCCNPICAHPAVGGDDDHTVPYAKGGRTCECGLGPACRKCHRTKQAPGWRLEQPSPGILIWHLPNGRGFTATPDLYPT